SLRHLCCSEVSISPLFRWPNLLNHYKELKADIELGEFSDRPFAIVGEKLAGEVKRKIQAGINPPLDPKTVKRKKSSKPLIDTGNLLQSITYEVRDK
ncbi:hypothetical protein AB7180_15570, partial [Providencia rettgeri]